jgi:MFS family permease
MDAIVQRIPLENAVTVEEKVDEVESSALSSEIRTIPQQKDPDSEGHNNAISLAQSVVIVAVLSGVSFLNTMGSGILTVALPRISKDLDLEDSLFFWPASVYALAAGCTLLIFGSLADVLGPKPVWVTGSGLYAVFTLACGLSKNGIQLIIFRSLLGISIAMCLPSAMSLTTKAFAPGTSRNICFACMGMGQPLGYSLGLILGGVFADTIGWRYGYYISAILNAGLLILAIYGLPKGEPQHLGYNVAEIRHKIIHEIDWVGAGLLSVSMGLLSYVLA